MDSWEEIADKARRLENMCQVMSQRLNALENTLRSSLIIHTNFIYPPIPQRDFDWAAWFDGEEEEYNSFGRTKWEAVANLIQHYKELEE